MRKKIPPRLTGEELREGLERALTEHFQASRRVTKLRRRLSAYSSSSTIETLNVHLERGRPLDVVLKDLSPGSMLPTARKVRPQFIYEPLRELEVYRRILDPRKQGTPICYGAVDSSERQLYWLFLERVRGPLLWQKGRLETWEQAAEWLAKLHTEFDTATRPLRQAQLTHLLAYNEDFLKVWVSRAETCLRQKNGIYDRGVWQRFGRVVDHYNEVIERLLRLPKTLIHGEFYPSNIILRATKRGWAICPVDWELAAIAPGLMDLAALTSGNWTFEQKHRLVAAYHRGLAPTQNWPPSLAKLMEDVECCQLHLAVQLLGWATSWRPPEAHAQDWLQEVLRLADKLGIGRSSSKRTRAAQEGTASPQWLAPRLSLPVPQVSCTGGEYPHSGSA